MTYGIYPDSVANPGPGIRCLFEPWIRDGEKSRSGSGRYFPDHISESLETIFWVKILKFFDADLDPVWIPDPGWKKIRIRDPE
jgi:hypothetical protein